RDRPPRGGAGGRGVRRHPAHGDGDYLHRPAGPQGAVRILWGWGMSTAGKVRSRAEAVIWRRAVPGPVVFTNGVFDLLHPGHVELLESARAEGAALGLGGHTRAAARA